MTPEVISPEPVHATGRKPSKALRILALIAGISVSATLFRAPTEIILYLAGVAVAIWMVKKFVNDNRGLFIKMGLRRTIEGFAQGFIQFIPFFLVILPGIAFAYTLNLVENEAFEWLDKFGRDGLPLPTPPPVIWYNPSTWGLSIFGAPVPDEVEVGMIEVRYWVRSLRVPIYYFLGLMSSCAWLIVGFAALRAYFHFVARIFALKGERITMELPHYRP